MISRLVAITVHFILWTFYIISSLSINIFCIQKCVDAVYAVVAIMGDVRALRIFCHGETEPISLFCLPLLKS